MLVLTRTKDAVIRITCPNGDAVDVVYCGKSHQYDHVRIGIHAPPEYRITRPGETDRFPGCRSPEKCEPTGRCPYDPVCNE